jgi:hypothetical protein
MILTRQSNLLLMTELASVCYLIDDALAAVDFYTAHLASPSFASTLSLWGTGC